MYCKECGTKWDEGVKFCGKCGHPLAEEPIVLDKKESEKELEKEKEHVMAADSNPESDEAQPSNAKNNRVLIFAIAGAAAVILILAAVFFLLPGSNDNQPLIYAKDNQLLLHNGGDDKPMNATDEIMDEKLMDEEDVDGSFYSYYLNYGVQLSADGKRLFFADDIDEDGEASLYMRDPSKALKDGGKGERIASNISVSNDWGFYITGDGGHVLYMKDYSYEEGGKLYLHNLKEEVLIDDEVSEVYPFSADDGSFMYAKRTDDGSDIYRRSIDTEAEKVKIDSDVYQVLDYSPNYEKIYYTKSDDGEEANHLTLYVKEAENDKKKLISDFSSAVSWNATDETFLFTRTTVESFTLYDLVKDDMLSGDEQIAEPIISDYETIVPYTDWWGDTYYDSVVDWDSYYVAQDAYYAKTERDQLREQLKSETIDDYTNTLFMYANGEEKEWVKELSSGVYYDASAKLAIYHKKESKSSSKLNLSEIYSAYDVSDNYYSQSRESEERYMVINGGSERELPVEEEDAVRIRLSDDLKKLYWIEQQADEYEGVLVSWDITEDGLDNRQELDEDVYSFEVIADRVWYYKDVKDVSGDLYAWKDGKKSEIGYDVRLWMTTIYPDDNQALYLSDYDEDDEMGTLYASDGVEKTKIADEVNAYYYRNASNLYYLTDFRISSHSGDLWEYRGKEDKRMIDDSVNAMLPLQTGEVL